MPRKHICMYERSGGSLECDICHKKPESYRERVKRQVAEIPQEVKQEILNLFHRGNSIGEVGEKVGLEIILVCGVIDENIDHVSFLRTRAI